MTLTAILSTLVLLALIDSTSLGTLLIPVWLLMTPGRVRVDRFLIYLFTVSGCYFAIGLIIMFGTDAFLNNYAPLMVSKPFLLGQLAIGILLMIISQLMDTKKSRARAAERAASGGGYIFKWRTRFTGEAVSSKISITILIGLALTAVILELGTMLPYLAAIGILVTEGPAWPMSGILLLGYCFVMILPALILLAGRLLAYPFLKQPLQKIDNWLMKNAQRAAAWIIGIVGFLLSVNAIYDLGWVQ
ncbi:Sap, sulfolipid-1-addressing protein [Paenibacillus polysaccharolyticus]|uniref:Sap, sulfolipid-1-addressing protein n=1 Tax=Paenibacillus polysaccharolyticus TaxID=582692 RepID=A0A1G5CT39_9BACL|nr:GAP family protein [Paenibacillus polysaccharolyticus]SCY05556.1 Sap, sulfolipid-1-addressing protein [Paenibacillus polysaccharolyticus]